MYGNNPGAAVLKAVLFDLDATLVNSRPIYNAAFAAAFQEILGMRLTERDRVSFMGLPTNDFLAQFSSGEQLERLAGSIKEYIAGAMPHVRLFDGLGSILPRLRDAGLKLGVVTSQNRFECEVSRRWLDLDAWIEVWVTAEDVVHPKPDPQPVTVALNQLGCLPEHGLMIGDSVFDLMAGRAAGARVGAACWGAADPTALTALKPDFIFNSPGDLQQIISLAASTVH